MAGQGGDSTEQEACSGLGWARTVLLQRSAAGVQSADLRQVAEPRGSRAWLRATPATLVPARGCQEAGTRRELELDTGADTDSWRGNSPDCWLLTATVLLSAFTWYRTWAGSMAHWLHWTTVTKSPSAWGLLVLISTAIYKCVNVLCLAMSPWFDDGINMRRGKRKLCAKNYWDCLYWKYLSCLITEEWGGCTGTGAVCTIHNFFLSLIWPLPHRVSAAADLALHTFNCWDLLPPAAGDCWLQIKETPSEWLSCCQLGLRRRAAYCGSRAVTFKYIYR